jgi:deoxycytidine triphosphate deaminase
MQLGFLEETKQKLRRDTRCRLGTEKMASPERKNQNYQEVGFLPGKEVLMKRLDESPYRGEILDFLKKNEVNLRTLLTWPEKGSFYLSDMGILRHFLAGNIVIHPFNIENLTPNSYEVTLGENYYQHKRKSQSRVIFELPRHAFREFPLLNPFDSDDIESTWELHQAISAEEFTKNNTRNNIKLEGIKNEDKIIVLQPHEMILVHTQEFIGGRNIVSTMISGRSSVGRSMIEICNDANLGHIGFINRWTLEIKNKSDELAIPLVVGQRYAQISFVETEPSAQSYQGEYQKGFNIEQIIASWQPEMMLPRMKRR